MSVPIGSKVLFKSELGVVRFVGETEFAPGVWIGVELQDANGKNDGSVKDVRYFECADKHGIFVRETMLEVVDESNILEVEKTRVTSRNGSRAQSRVSSRINSRSSDVMPINDQDETARLRSIIQKLQDKLLAMRSDIEKLKSSLQGVEGTNLELQEKILKAEEELEISAIDKETLEEQNELYKQEIASLTEQNESVLKGLQALKDEVSYGMDDRDSSLINESTDSLIRRNSLLEAALVKLRDHADMEKARLTEAVHELQEKIEPLSNAEVQYKDAQKRLIEAEQIIDDLRAQIETSIHSAEIIESLTNKNNELMEENQKLHSNLKELEDLRKVEEELELFHNENEKNLQQEIRNLKASLENQQNGVKRLEERNRELHNKAEELQQLQQRNGSKIDDLRQEEKRTFPSGIQNSDEKPIANLKLKLLEIEISHKEEEVNYLEGAIGNSKVVAHKKASLLLKKYTEIYECLALSITKPKSDLFISILVTKLQFNLRAFSLFLRYANLRYEYAVSHKELQLVGLEDITTRLIKIVEDEDYREVPNLKDAEDEIMSQIEDIRSVFQNRTDFTYEIQLEVNSLETVLAIITLLSTREAKERFDFSNLELTKLYQFANQQKSKMVRLLNRLTSLKEHSNETSKISFFQSTPQITKFVQSSVNLITRSDPCTEDTPSLASETNSLLSFLELHKDDDISWTVSDTESTWFLSQTGSSQLRSSELQSLQDELQLSQAEIQKKDKSIEEISLKVNVLTSRLAISKETESQLKMIKEEVSSLRKEKDDLTARIHHLSDSNQKLSSELHKARNNALLNSSQFETLLEQKRYNEKAELISELHSLRNVVRTLTKRRKDERSWLRIELSKRTPFEKKEADELRLIGRDLRKAVQNAKFYSLKG